MSLAWPTPVGFGADYPTMSNLINSAVLTAIANSAHFLMAPPPRCGSLAQAKVRPTHRLVDLGLMKPAGRVAIRWPTDEGDVARLLH